MGRSPKSSEPQKALGTETSDGQGADATSPVNQTDAGGTATARARWAHIHTPTYPNEVGILDGGGGS